MKKALTSILLLALLLTNGCESFLHDEPEVSITDQEVFGNYEAFQGYIDAAYSGIIQYSRHSLSSSMCIGGECASVQTWSSAYRGITGQYKWWIGTQGNEPLQSNFHCSEDNQDMNAKNSGIWPDSWRGIRICNIALSNIDLLTDATQEQKNWIEGQAYFLRAYFHWEIIRNWGSMPYLDEESLAQVEWEGVLLPRYWDYYKDGQVYSNWQACAERIAEDLDQAAQLLPPDWGAYLGRATKGAALATKAKVLLYAGSPLMLKDAGKDYGTPANPVFESGYMERSAQAAWQVIKLANNGVYQLTSWKDYQNNFGRNDGYVCFSSPEWIWGPMSSGLGSGVFLNRFKRVFYVRGCGICETPVQEYVDKFEMNDGSTYLPGPNSLGGYDDIEEKRWLNRDPRFRKAIFVDGDTMGYHEVGIVHFHNGNGSDLDAGSVLTPYTIKKYLPRGVNQYDQMWAKFTYNTPHIRLAEMYLIYAEAVYEATGQHNQPPNFVEGSSLTALDALNTLRQRIMDTEGGEPYVLATESLKHYNSFRGLLRNERAVELCFEGQYWYDNRRWRIAHTLPKELYKLDFPPDYSYFKRKKVTNYVFENRHYWLPIPFDQVDIYEGFPQNPGW